LNYRKKQKLETIPNHMAIQILYYEFLGPIKLSEWGPPMDEVVYAIMAREKDTFKIIYLD